MPAARYNKPLFYKPAPLAPTNSHILTMERNFAAVTIFTLLFAVSTARISLDPKPTDYLPLVQPHCATTSLPENSNNLVIIPSETQATRSESDESDQKSEIRVDLTPRSEYARFHAINRRFFDEHRVPIRSDIIHRRPERRFQNPLVMPRSELTLNAESGKFDGHNFHRHGASSSRMKFKHDYGHGHGHRHQHQHRHVHHNNNNDVVSTPKHRFVREKPKSLVHQHKEESRGHEASFMKSIRKFLKHSFD